MEVDANGLEILDRDECLRLLAHGTIGRVATTSRGLPVIVPVNYCLRDDVILFRTGPGAKLDSAIDNAVVAFEVDDFDPLYHSGWSVNVTGRAVEIVGDDLDCTERAPVSRWAPFGGGHMVSISTDMVSGRRLARF